MAWGAGSWRLRLGQGLKEDREPWPAEGGSPGPMPGRQGGERPPPPRPAGGADACALGEFRGHPCEDEWLSGVPGHRQGRQADRPSPPQSFCSGPRSLPESPGPVTGPTPQALQGKATQSLKQAYLWTRLSGRSGL